MSLWASNWQSLKMPAHAGKTDSIPGWKLKKIATTLSILAGKSHGQRNWWATVRSAWVRTQLYASTWVVMSIFTGEIFCCVLFSFWSEKWINSSTISGVQKNTLTTRPEPTRDSWLNQVSQPFQTQPEKVRVLLLPTRMN